MIGVKAEILTLTGIHSTQYGPPSLELLNAAANLAHTTTWLKGFYLVTEFVFLSIIRSKSSTCNHKDFLNPSDPSQTRKGTCEIFDISFLWNDDVGFFGWAGIQDLWCPFFD
jgi:hypothetical protein